MFKIHDIDTVVILDDGPITVRQNALEWQPQTTIKLKFFCPTRRYLQWPPTDLRGNTYPGKYRPEQTRHTAIASPAFVKLHRDSHHNLVVKRLASNLVQCITNVSPLL